MVLAVGLFRAGFVGWPAAALFGLSGAALLVTSAGPVRGVLLAAAGAALLGFAWVAARLTPPELD